MNTLDRLIKTDTTRLNFKLALAQLVNDPAIAGLEPDSLRALAWFYHSACKKTARAIKLDNPFKLASLFIGKKDVRFYLNHIYSTGSELIGSNGAILIKIAYSHEPGYYDALGQKANIDQGTRYPDIGRHLVGVGALEPIDLDEGTNVMLGTTHACKLGEGYYAKAYIDLIKKCGATNARADDVNTLFFDIPNMHATGVLMPLKKP